MRYWKRQKRSAKKQKNDMKIASRMKHVSITCFIVLLFLLDTTFAYATNMSNAFYFLQMGNLNSFASRKSGSGYILQDTGGQIAPGLYSASGVNYQVKAGFQYVPRGARAGGVAGFAFAVSSQIIDFGKLTPSNPLTRTQTLTITNGSAYGYRVTIAENHQMLVANSGARIPDTSCDNGSCTPTTAALWTNPLTYGLGYRCDNVSGTPCVFTTSNYYTQLANNEFGQIPQNILAGTNVVSNNQATITYKVNISGSQPPGDYANIVTYVATPTF